MPVQNDFSSSDKIFSLLIQCREEQIEMLQSRMGKPHDLVNPILIFGHTSTGKSYVLRNLLKHSKVRHVIANCTEAYSNRFLFEHILSHLSGNIPSFENNYTIEQRCDNLNDFVRHVKKITSSLPDSSETTYIVLDKAERLMDMDPNLLPAFLELQSSTNLNICVILISQIPWCKFGCGASSSNITEVLFPNYSYDALIKILSEECPPDYTAEFYIRYCKIVLDLFYPICSNVVELKHLVTINFSKYVEPIKNEEASIDDSRKLWKNIEPHLKTALKSIYLGEVSNSQFTKLEPQSSTLPQAHSTTIDRHAIELPFYSKYLLIAGYLASYNPIKSDKRFFVKKSEKMKRRQVLQSKKKNERTANQLLGPKSFTIDRLQAIFYSIIDERISPTANIYCQISSLVTLGLFDQLTAIDSLSSPKYKCIVSLDFIKSISKTVGFEVTLYLFDFT